MLYILHISDLHFVKNAGTYNTKAIILKEVANRVKSIPKGKKLLIVTGDFHNFFDTDYEPAEKFLKQLVADMNIDINQDVFVVPGNHDVGNDEALKSFLEAEDPNWKKHDKSSVTMIKQKDLDYVSERLRAFRPYCEFVRKLGIYDESKGKDYPAQVHVRQWRGKLNILHLNTALIANGNEKNNQMVDTSKAASDEIWETISGNDVPTIAIGHNNFYDLEEGQRFQIATTFMLHNVRAYLCGDNHLTEKNPERQMIRLTSGYGKSNTFVMIPNLVAARGIADNNDLYSEVGYCWHHWNEETGIVSVEFRKWTQHMLASTQSNGEDGFYGMYDKIIVPKESRPGNIELNKQKSNIKGSGTVDDNANNNALIEKQLIHLNREKKYQVYISSTYNDLKDERNEVVHAILDAHCIPAGIRAYFGSNNLKWEYIKHEINQSDIFLVFIAGKYGTERNDNHGKKISYVEMEYNYAKGIGKPILAFTFFDTEQLTSDRVEKTIRKKNKLKKFISKLETESMWKKWTNKDNLKAIVLSTLNDVIATESSRMLGWVRPDPTDQVKNSSRNEPEIDILDAAGVIELEGSVKNNSQIIILSSRFELDSEKKLIQTITRNMQKGCTYNYVFASSNWGEFLQVCSLWWHQLYEDLSASDDIDIKGCTKEYFSIKEKFSSLHGTPPDLELIRSAKHYLLSHINAYMYDTAFVPTTIALYERGEINETLPLLKRNDFDVLIPLPSSEEYYAYLIPEKERRAIDTIIHRAKAFCIPPQLKPIKEEEIK